MTADEQKIYNNGFILGMASKGVITNHLFDIPYQFIPYHSELALCLDSRFGVSPNVWLNIINPQRSAGKGAYGFDDNNVIYPPIAGGGGSIYIDEPDTIYLVADFRQSPTKAVPILTKGMNTNTGLQNYCFDLFTYQNSISFVEYGVDIQTDVLSDGLHAVCIRRSGTDTYFYIDGVLKYTKTNYKGKYSGYFYVSYMHRGSLSFAGVGVNIRFLAMGGVETEAGFQDNMDFIQNHFVENYSPSLYHS